MSTSEHPRVGIVSAAQTPLREAWTGAQHVDLLYTVVSDALRGSGLDIGDVDVVIDSGSDVLDGRSISNCGFLGAMGAHFKEESRVEDDGLFGAAYAMNKVAAGGARVALVIGYSKPSESDVAAYYASIAEPFFTRPVGFDHRVAAGLLAQQYLAATGLPEDVLLDVAEYNWARAAANNTVETPAEYDRAAIEASEVVAHPLHRMQISRPLDGAVAVLLATEHIARRCTDRPVWLTGTGSATEPHLFTQRKAGEFEACATAARAAYRRAGMTVPAVDLAEVSATSAAAELMVLEALGLAEPGKAIGLYDQSAPVLINPSGGALPADPIMATGLVRMAEAYVQLSGQIDRGAAVAPRSAVVHGAGGLAMQNHAVFTLEV